MQYIAIQHQITKITLPDTNLWFIVVPHENYWAQLLQNVCSGHHVDKVILSLESTDYYVCFKAYFSCRSDIPPTLIVECFYRSDTSVNFYYGPT